MKKRKKKKPGIFLTNRVVELVLAGSIDWSDAVLLSLIYNYSKMRDGCCTATNETLARKMGMEIRGVQRQITRMESKLLLERALSQYSERYLTLTKYFHNESYFPKP